MVSSPIGSASADFSAPRWPLHFVPRSCANFLSALGTLVAHKLNEFFLIQQRGSSISTELYSGTVTYITMSYILVVNPRLLTLATGYADTTDNTTATQQQQHADGDYFASMYAATCLSACLGCMWVGIGANLPFGLAAGMGLNSFFTYGVCWLLHVSPSVALAAVLAHGLLFSLIASTGLCHTIQNLVPDCIQKATTTAVGLFLAFIGFRLIRLVVPSSQNWVILGNMTDVAMWVAITEIFIIGVLLSFDMRGSIIFGVMGTACMMWLSGNSPPPTALIGAPQLASPWEMINIQGYLNNFGRLFWVSLSFLLVSLFDTTSVQRGAGHQLGLMADDDTIPGSKQAFLAASVATSVGALFGCSPITIHNESMAGILAGARTGLAACSTGVLFLLSLPFWPFFSAVPVEAAAAPLIIIGIFMMSPCRHIDWDDLGQAFPAFLTISVMPLTSSIANGIAAGLVSFFALKALCKGVQSGAEWLLPLWPFSSSKDNISPRVLSRSPRCFWRAQVIPVKRSSGSISQFSLESATLTCVSHGEELFLNICSPIVGASPHLHLHHHPPAEKVTLDRVFAHMNGTAHHYHPPDRAGGGGAEGSGSGPKDVVGGEPTADAVVCDAANNSTGSSSSPVGVSIAVHQPRQNAHAFPSCPPEFLSCRLTTDQTEKEETCLEAQCIEASSWKPKGKMRSGEEEEVKAETAVRWIPATASSTNNPRSCRVPIIQEPDDDGEIDERRQLAGPESDGTVEAEPPTPISARQWRQSIASASQQSDSSDG
eukprot:GHVS01064418.1.p1 GENE.GHVS01064418.1~~GHVS01064418.1.p1  ORF type:complete len:770 (+),score=111.20 GHVS01064418.1:226-2535(+)